MDRRVDSMPARCVEVSCVHSCEQEMKEKKANDKEGSHSNIGAGDNKNCEPRSKQLTQEWVQVLINLRMKHAKLFTRKRHSAMNAWTSIYDEMIDLGAPKHITVDKIKKKWMNLVARYKHFKFVLNASGTISWPYFDQIDRAYARNPNIIELRKNFRSGNCSLKLVESDSDNESVTAYADSMMKRQQFTSILIQLRCAYKHLFTGKKYAAQRGWMVVKNMHPDGENYTVDQFSKCWQNLTQRYRTLIDTEKDHSKISWMHFPTMHKVMERLEAYTSEKSSVNPPSPVSLPSEENHEDELSEGKTNDFFDEEEDNAFVFDQLILEEPKNKRRRTCCENGDKENETPIDDLLKYLIQRDIRLDEQHDQLMKVLNNIHNKLGE
ncbi:uncharacterized protein [Atheta coriaria]|uniref:uncharacterized protein isoform X3 n=1 Tax=Dalotia coriaria TaxID=877792 RepID=UPI0031F3E3C5